MDISQATSQASTTFTDVLFGTPSPYMIMVLAVVSALVGMIAHWAKVYYKEQDAEALFDWFFVKNKRATFMAVGGMLGTLATTLGPLDVNSVTVFQVLTQSFTIGYVADSVFNTDVPKAGDQKDPPPPQA